MKRILFVRNKSDVNLQAIIANLDLNHFEISILDLKGGELINHNAKKALKIINIPNERILGYIFRYFIALLYLLRFSNKYYDVIHIMNIKRENFWILPFFRKQASKLFISVYGRSTFLYWSKRILFRSYFKCADYIIFTNPVLRDEFARWYKNVDQEKMIIGYLPMINVSNNPKKIDKHTINEFCTRFNISRDLIRISCSSTIASYDQHDKVIDALKNIVHKDKVQLMFLLTYGGSEMEKQRLINRITNELAGFNYAIIDTFLDNEEMAAYRKLTDIYINMRISDQMAGAVIESLYEGALLLSASWLNYQTLDDIGVTYYKVPSFDTLQPMIDDKILAIQSFKQEYANENRNKILKEFSLESTIKKWTNLYTS
jgi:glycosyltransferase involved in cell wall biosynthesis